MDDKNLKNIRLVSDTEKKFSDYDRPNTPTRLFNSIIVICIIYAIIIYIFI